MSVRATIRDLSVELGGNRILERVSLDVQPGEFLTLLGPSGSGKTTMLNVIAGLVPHVEGQVAFDGESIEGLPSYARDIGLVFQSYALFPHMTVEDNIAFPLLARKVPKPKRRERVQEMLELVRLPGLEKRLVTTLSGGQQQRVALARALASHPRLLLLDEPMAALDKNLRDLMQLELKRIQRETGITTIAVTHDQTEALTMSDRVAIMHQGRIEQVDEPRALYQRPQNLFVSRFLGEANLFPVRDGRVTAFDIPVVGSSHGLAMLRPESLTVTAGQHDSPPRLHARVVSAVFQGSRTRLVLEADGEGLQPIVVSSDPSADVRSFQPGTAVTVTCDPRDIHVVPEDDPDSPGSDPVEEELESQGSAAAH
jgi:putative spermidine/putrescine transport system ATP-binding protein